MCRALYLIFIFTLHGSLVLASDWPAYQSDHERSGYTTDKLVLPLAGGWSRKEAAAQPAWPTSKRLQFDFSSYPVVAEGRVFIGSSATGALTAVDGATGKVLWTFYTNGPIRFAPTVAHGRVYVVSDDGRLYCLDAATGDKKWSKQGGPSAQMCLGNGRLISRWPARCGATVYDDIVYFAAGIWPSDGFYLHALDAISGKVRWSNDSTGGLHMGQPHGGAFAESGVSGQGYLAADATNLYVPTGRSVPAVFDRETGAYKYFYLQANGGFGGFAITLSRNQFVNGGALFDKASGKRTAKFPSRLVVSTPTGLVSASGKNLAVSSWQTVTEADRKGKPQEKIKLAKPRTIALPHSALSLIVADGHAITGALNAVAITDLKTGKVIWKATVKGAVYGLAVADGRLYASSNTGHQYCFAAGTAVGLVQATANATAHSVSSSMKATAAAILKRAEVNAGYCVDVACENGELAQAIAEQSHLHVIAVTQSAAHAKAVRERLVAVGLYASRVTVVLQDSAFSPLPDYVANLVVSSRALEAGADSVNREDADRILRPWGGVLCIGTPETLMVDRRGALEGAGQWTHQYGNPGNTVCSDDKIVGGSLGMLWFGDMRQQMTQRHGRAPAPLVYKGVIYSEGLHGLIAVDAFTGRKLWELELPNILKAYDGDHLMGVSGTGGNYCVADSGIYIRMENRCLRVDRHTGKLLNTFTAPASAGGGAGEWGYIAVTDGVLVGSLSNSDHVVTYRYQNSGNMKGQLTESHAIFAVDAESGKLKWKVKATHSIRHNTIAIGDGSVLFIDKALAEYDRSKRGKATGATESGRMLALDLHTGKEKWAVDTGIYGTTLAISVPHQSVVMGYQPTRFSLASEIGGRISCFNLATGAPRWEKKVNYSSRLILNDRTIYAQGAALDLLTGKPIPFNFDRSYGCGIMAASRDLMVFRSATLGYFDFNKNDRVRDFGGIRPGCWINVIPANGLVLAPDASSGCKCSYLNKAWIALQPNRTPPRPVISPAGGSFRESTTVTLDAPGRIHYTLDGSTPSITSPRYVDALQIAESTRLKCMMIDASGSASTVRETTFTINPNMLTTTSDGWRAIDATVGTKERSNWQSKNGTWTQTSNIYSSTPKTLSKNPAVERLGTFLVLVGDTLPAKREISLKIRSGDNDGIGIAFDFVDPQHYTLLALNAERKFRAVLRKNGDSFEQLAGNTAGYTKNKWHALRILRSDKNIKVFIDEKLEFDVPTPAGNPGSIALYAWGNSKSEFSQIEVSPITP